MGRKPTVKGGKLQILSLRTTKALRKRLEAAAKASGRSLSAEVEERLHSSFIGRDEIFGGGDLYRLMSMMAIAIRTIEEADGERWYVYSTLRKVTQVCPQIIEMMAGSLPGSLVRIGDRAVDTKMITDAAQAADQFIKDFHTFLLQRHKEQNPKEYERVERKFKRRIAWAEAKLAQAKQQQPPEPEAEPEAKPESGPQE